MQKGNSNIEGIAILAILLIVIIIMPKGGSLSTNNPSRSETNTSSGESTVSAPDSSYARSISLSNGNASSAYQSYEEYVTINNRGKDHINITGWYLKNGKDSRAYNLGGDLSYFSSDIATIGKAALFVSPIGQNILQDVILQPGEKAIIITGTVGAQAPYKIASFKENICSGYLESLPEYKFTPALKRNCPRPADEEGVSSLDNECRKFIERMSSCRTPEFDTLDSEGDICHSCVDGKLLSSACVTFIKNHFNYGSCIANYANDPNFSGKTWRIFLGHSWEMWAKDYETIELFDQFGKLVTSRSY